MSSNPYPSTEVSTDPVAQYLDATGAGLHLFEAARANKLPATLHHLYLASLVCNGDLERRALVARQIEYACRVMQLKAVAFVPYTLQKGQLIDRFELLEAPRKVYFKSELGLYLIHKLRTWLRIPSKHSWNLWRRKPRRASHTMNADYWIIHRDDARRYFQTIQWVPEEGSPLWCWIHGASEQEKGKLRPDQQDKADFQQLCMEHWQVSPTTRIRGKQGIVALIGTAYLRSYTQDTLKGWASEVAPPEVKARRGRPRKTPVEQ